MLSSPTPHICHSGTLIICGQRVTARTEDLLHGLNSNPYWTGRAEPRTKKCYDTRIQKLLFVPVLRSGVTQNWQNRNRIETHI